MKQQDSKQQGSKKTPTILAENIEVQSRIFTVQSQQLEFSNGTQVTYERLVSNSDGAVLIVPLLANDNLLLIREYGAGVGRYELGFPKGKIDPGETWKEASVRESQEEVGHKPSSVELLDSLSLAAGYMTHQTHIVMATELEPNVAIGDEPEPLEVIEWPLHKWTELLAHPEFSEGRAYAALMLVLKHKQFI